MNTIKIYTYNEAETKHIAFELGSKINKPFYIALKGDLGAGKTAFVQGLAEGLKTDPNQYVTSPTYNILQLYQGKQFTLLHADLYRISDIDELELTGFTDILHEQECVLAVEWPQKIEQDFDFDLIVDIKIPNADTREINLISCGLKAKHLINNCSFNLK